MHLEDGVCDILAKAMAGHGFSVEDLIGTGFSKEAVEAVLSGDLDVPEAEGLAHRLKLDLPALRRIASGSYCPKVDIPSGLKLFTTPFPVPGYEEMTVNAYLYFDTSSRDAVIFDTGADANGILDVIAENFLNVRAIYLTHAHRDHIAGLDLLRTTFPTVPIWIDSKELFSVAQAIDEEDSHVFDGFKVASCSTSGHSPGGRTYILNTESMTLAVVGDALFAGSMGGARNQLPISIAALRQHVLSLPEQTILCPGHGPLTTVALERVNNAFLASRV
jgi:glyoxylase-like metal-dependent hydrolase (beta-lactamase superfamily II)